MKEMKWFMILTFSFSSWRREWGHPEKVWCHAPQPLAVKTEGPLSWSHTYPNKHHHNKLNISMRCPFTLTSETRSWVHLAREVSVCSRLGLDKSWGWCTRRRKPTHRQTNSTSHPNCITANTYNWSCDWSQDSQANGKNQ